MNHSHLQVEYTDENGYLEEAWIPNEHVKSEFNIFDDIMDIAVTIKFLDEEGIPYA